MSCEAEMAFLETHARFCPFGRSDIERIHYLAKYFPRRKLTSPSRRLGN
jgi:hypothetical protein